jgi:asparagine synthase (glutamine-hydrolysing)
MRRYPDCYRGGLLERLLDRQMGRYESGLRFASRHAEEYYRCATAGHDLAHVEQQCRIGLMHGIDVSHPFRDRDLVAFLMAIPGEAVNYHGVPKGLVREALSGMLPDAIRDRRSKADFTAFHGRAVLRDLPVMRQLLTRDCLSVQAGFVDGDVIERSVQNLAVQIAEAGDTTASWQLGNLIGLEIWLRCFFARDRDRSAGIACTTS